MRLFLFQVVLDGLVHIADVSLGLVAREDFIDDGIDIHLLRRSVVSHFLLKTLVDKGGYIGNRDDAVVVGVKDGIYLGSLNPAGTIVVQQHVDALLNQFNVGVGTGRKREGCNTKQ